MRTGGHSFTNVLTGRKVGLHVRASVLSVVYEVRF